MATKHTPEQLVIKLFRIVSEAQSIEMRALVRKFNARQRPDVEKMIRDAVAFGSLRMEGTGRKGSPFIIRAVG